MTTQPADAGQSAPFKTFIALPFYGVDPVFVQCLMTLMSSNMKELGIGGIQTNIGDSSPTRARNTLTYQFLERKECDQILFLDSDIMFNVEQLKRLLSHRELVVGGFYAKKQQGPGALVCNSYPQDKQPAPREDGLQAVRYMGAGCLLVKRAVFEIMIAKMGDKIVFHPDEVPDHVRQYAFWQETPYEYPDGTRRFLTEDWRFCQLCLDLGIQVWADTRVVLGHRGPVEFPLETQKENIFGLRPVVPAPALSNLPVETTGAGAISLPSTFKFPAEAADDAKDIFAGCYDVPLKEPPKSVLDAGAHVGLFSEWASQRWPGCKIQAFEPCKETNDALMTNLRARDIQIVQAAIFNHNKELTMRRGMNSLCHSANPGCAKGTEFTVPCVDAKTLPSFDFVKLDVEGAEIPVLSVLDLSNTRALVCESHSESDRITIRQSLERAGFVCIYDQPTLDSCRLIKMARPEALAK